MLESLQLVSGLPRETAGEALLAGALSALGVVFHRSRLSDYKPVSPRCADRHIVVLLVPVLGDNDLTAETHMHLARLVTCGSYRHCSIVVIAQGDRHVSDEFVAPDSPFSIKVHRLFSAAGAFELLETKLDRFTAVALAREIADLGDATNISDIRELNGIARLLPRAPRWHARERRLDFYDAITACSLLKLTDRTSRKHIARHIYAVAPRILKMTHAGLDDWTLSDMRGALQAEVIDLGSNDISWDALVQQLGACRWLGLAANGLTRVHLSLLPRKLEHLYLHKNNLHEFAAMPSDVSRLKSLSLYRNRVAAFEWPAGQTSLARLNLGANPISELPETLGDCVSLEFLGLARTKLSYLPEWVLSLPELRELDISYIEEQIPPAQIAHLRGRHVSLITRPGLVIS